MGYNGNITALCIENVCCTLSSAEYIQFETGFNINLFNIIKQKNQCYLWLNWCFNFLKFFDDNDGNKITICNTYNNWNILTIASMTLCGSADWLLEADKNVLISLFSGI